MKIETISDQQKGLYYLTLRFFKKRLMHIFKEIERDSVQKPNAVAA